MWFFYSTLGSTASGFLDDRLKNQRKKIAATKASNCDSELDNLVALDWESENEAGNLKNL